MSALMTENATPICVSSSRRRGEPEARYSGLLIKTSPVQYGLMPDRLIDFVTSTQTTQTEADPRPEQRTHQGWKYQRQGGLAVAGQGAEPQLNQLGQAENHQKHQALLPHREHPQTLL